MVSEQLNPEEVPAGWTTDADAEAALIVGWMRDYVGRNANSMDDSAHATVVGFADMIERKAYRPGADTGGAA